MPWTAYVDGGSRGNPGPGAAGVQILDPAGKVVFEAGFFLGRVTNNAAEYGGLLAAIDALAHAAADDVVIISDSQLMVRQILGEYRVKSADLRPLYERAVAGLHMLGKWQIRHVLREGNTRADELANLAMDHQEDVIVTVTAPTDTTTAKPQPAASPDGVEVLIVRGPKGKNACPAGMSRKAGFRFSTTTPEGLCVEACAAILPAVQKIQRGEDQKTTVHCPRPGCGAVFEVSALRDPRAG